MMAHLACNILAKQTLLSCGCILDFRHIARDLDACRHAAVTIVGRMAILY